AFNTLGRKTAVLGTLGNGFPNALSAAINTTPDPIKLQGMLADYLKQGAQAVAMEVSSHGLYQGRVNGVHFDVAVLTNLTRDHLDYHGDMAGYAAAKRKLFDWDSLGCAVLNVDDEFGHQVSQELTVRGKRVLSYGLRAGDVRGSELKFNDKGFTMQVSTPFGSDTLRVPLLGRFNAYNALAVLATLLVSKVPLDDAVNVMAQLEPVAGRMQRYGGGHQPIVVIDYAHTPDALENVLSTLREQVKGELVCVFGCGGDRDAGKRPLMGKVASKLADKVILTSDNPRSEKPLDIIDAISTGIEGEYSINADRTSAIMEAVTSAEAGDIVLVAGKGHENYQEIAGVKHPYSDMQAVQKALERMAA
ncbi:MAG: UDP-N-acetylmuramoyl-L-alanyl-D-glutamate--2,6-diaminopimelate ligase, partial [Methylophilaceae bacterium]